MSFYKRLEPVKRCISKYNTKHRYNILIELIILVGGGEGNRRIIAKLDKLNLKKGVKDGF